MSFDSAAIRAVLDQLLSHALALGLFERVNGHEAKNAPGNGLSLSVWADVIRPLPQASGLNSTSGLVSFHCRLMSNMLAEPQDDIDPAILSAVSALMEAYSGDFTLGGNVRNVDLLGQFGVPLSAQAGYLNLGGTLFRVMVITLPVVINDMWDQVATVFPGSSPVTFSFLPLPSGTPVAGQVPVATGLGEASAWATISGRFLCAPRVYAPGAQTALAVTSTSLAAFSSGNVCTNSFTAPPSGSVLVRATFVAEETGTAGKIAALGLAAIGTTSPVFGNLVTAQINALTSVVPFVAEFAVTGLTPGSFYQFDLLGAAASGFNFTILAVGTQTPNLLAGGLGSPVTMTVQAI